MSKTYGLIVFSALLSLSATAYAADSEQKASTTTTESTKSDGTGAVHHEGQSVSQTQKVDAAGGAVTAESEAKKGSHSVTSNPDGSTHESKKENTSATAVTAQPGGSVQVDKKKTESEHSESE